MPIKVLNQTGYAIYRAVVQSHLTAYVQFHRYVANLTMNSTVNGYSESSSCFALLYSTASKIGVTITYCLIFIVSLVANSLIVTIVYKTPNLKKPINYFIANMAFSDILSAIFWMPLNLSVTRAHQLLTYWWSAWPGLVKLVFFFGNLFRFDTESDSDCGGSIWGRGVSTAFATHQIQTKSLLHSCHVDSGRSYLFAKFDRRRYR